jgi:hypothetical protein
MKGDFSRQTFDPKKHYSGVRMQQGRVQLDADWNEQGDLVNYRAETAAADVIGRCGGPVNNAAFHIVANADGLTAEEKQREENQYAGTLKPGDFLISAGRYYVDGILCENEHILSLGDQDKGDLPGAEPIQADETGLHVVYLDVWRRHLTVLDDPRLREVALGGPDTATRIKTVWQVRRWYAGPAAEGNCGTTFAELDDLLKPGTGLLTARSRQEEADTDPCLVPPSAGYRGLENQLYRVEIHHPGEPFDVAGAADEIAVTAFPAPNQMQLADVHDLDPGQPVELVRTGGDPMAAQFAYLTAVDPTTKTVTLSVDITALEAADEPRLRWVGETAVFKWSRDNGSVVSAIEGINGTEVAVRDLGPDAVLGFAPNQWVEISDDRLELNGQPRQLLQIASVTPGPNPVVTLKSAPAPWGPGGTLDKTRHPKLRRWDGVAAVKRHPANPASDWIELESGVQVQFSAGTYKSGDYWLIPARAATADAQSGKLEWPADQAGKPLPQPPAGIRHHYSRLAVLQFNGETITSVEDCRNLFPPLRGDGIHITSVWIHDVHFESRPVRNDTTLHADELAKGIRVECDHEISGDSVKDKPVCFVTLDLPFPFNQTDRALWADAQERDPPVFAFQPLILLASTQSESNNIIWEPALRTKIWLEKQLLQTMKTQGRGDRVLAHLTLKGNFIWARDDPDLFLDGEAFGQPGAAITNLRLPSGDGRRGGDFEMWFWLIGRG